MYFKNLQKRTAPPPPTKTLKLKPTGGDFGIIFSEKPENKNKPVIQKLILFGPAFEAGLQCGDCIVEVSIL